MFHSAHHAVMQMGRGQSALVLLLTFEYSLLIYALSEELLCVSFQLATETTVLDGQSVPGLWR